VREIGREERGKEEKGGGVLRDRKKVKRKKMVGKQIERKSTAE